MQANKKILKALWNITPGYVIIKAEGIRPQRLPELCGCFCSIYDCKRLSYTSAQMKVKYFCLRRVRRIAKSCGIEVHVIRKSIFSRLADAAISRWWLVIFAAAAFAAIAVASGKCYDISISGTDLINEFELDALLRENGADPPFKKSEIDLFELRRAIIKKFPQAAVAELGYTGVRLNVRIAEGELLPERTEKISPSAVIAKRGGVIESITVGAGAARVSVGQTVKAGDVLIDGIYKKKETEFRTAARGSITALTDYIGRGESDAGRAAATEKAYFDALAMLDEKAVPVKYTSYASEKNGITTAVAVITVREDIGETAPYGTSEEYGADEADSGGV